jgi:hypothetical protein
VFFGDSKVCIYYTSIKKKEKGTRDQKLAKGAEDAKGDKGWRNLSLI